MPVSVVPDKVDDVDEQLEFLLRPSGIMRRRVELLGSWYKDGIGPLLAATKDGKVIALLPGKFGGYTYFDHSSAKKVKVTKKTAEHIGIDAYCFYKALPSGKLTVRDLLIFMVSSFDFSALVMAAATTLAVTLLGMLIPYANKQLFTNVITSGQNFQVLAVAVLLFGASLSTALINITSQVLIAKITIKVNVAVQSASMARVLTLPASFFKEYSAGNLAQRLSNLNMLSGQMEGIIIKTGLSTLMSLFYIVQLEVFAPSLVPATIGIILTGLGFAVISCYAAAKASHAEMKEKAKVSGLVFSLFSGVKKIRLAGCEQRAFSKWARTYEKAARRKYAPPFFVRISPVIQTAIMSIGAVFLFYTAGKNHIELADFMAFTAGFGMISAALIMLTRVGLMVSAAKPTLDMAKPILEAEPELASGKKIISELRGEIEISNLSFRYREDMPLALDGVSLKIRPGQYVAITGASGCGKSTLFRLLLGFEKPSKGAIYYDSKDMNSFDLKSLRKNIGCVIQNGKLMSGDIFSNIIVSAPTLTFDDAWEAAELAGIAEDIRLMPMGMHTFIGESGGGFSGGQKQRLLIARAIAPKPKILMLDEATSALDNITQKHVSQSLDKLKCTRIVIAHRLSTIKQCSRIIFMEKGKILEDGTYDELVALNGKFAELVKRQELM